MGWLIGLMTAGLAGAQTNWFEHHARPTGNDVSARLDVPRRGGDLGIYVDPGGPSASTTLADTRHLVPAAASHHAGRFQCGNCSEDAARRGPLADDQWPCVHCNCPPQCWSLQVLPTGLVYRPYLAGVKESRISGTAFYAKHGGWFLDVALGGRVGILRYGTTRASRPEGWQVDIEGAGFPRLNLEKNWDLESVDFRFGVPLTYGVGPFQTKLAYYHLSSHLGDELALREPDRLPRRINFSRDVIVLGVSYFPDPAWRLYGEAGWAFHSDGGSDPWEFQFGTELVPPAPTGLAGAPFFAANGHLRQELDYGGDATLEAGWAWRGRTGSLFRVGAQWLNGMSSQYQFFDRSEQQIGLGIWYDY